MSKDLTVVILTKNEADNLRHLLPALSWVKKIMIVDSLSSDQTKQVAKQYGAEFISCSQDSFAQKRNTALSHLKTNWVLYLDADERLTPALITEISQVLASQRAHQAYKIRRQNYCYGYPLNYGGWGNDWVTRLFQTKFLLRWQGEIHESPIYEGELGVINHPLWHFTHRSTAANLAKSSTWTIKEAQLLADAATAPVNKYTILRKILGEFYRRYFVFQGYKDGMVGFVESLTQAFNRGWVYMQVWELQQVPSIAERYQCLEKKVAQINQTSCQ